MTLVATRILDFVSKNPRFDKNMARPKEYGALDFFMQQTAAENSIITAAEREAIKASIGKTAKIPVINYDGQMQISNVRSCTIPANDNTSAMKTVTFVTYSTGFRMIPELHMNNEISYAQDFGRKMEKVIRVFGNALDVAAIAALETNKTQVNKDNLIYSFSGNVLEAPYGYREEILGDLNPIMRSNDYNGMIHIIGNAGVDSLVRKLAQHDLYNDQNKTLEFEDKVMHFTTNLVNASGKYGTFFAVEDGNVAMLTRFDRAALAGTKVGTDEFGTAVLPLLGLEVGTHYKHEIGDVATLLEGDDSVADMVCNEIEYYGFSVDVAFVTAYNSAPTTIANPIIKAQIAQPAAGTAAAKDVNVVATV